MSGIPVFLKNASPKTPSMITTLAARSKIGADATNESPNERLANVPCKFVIPSRRKFEPNCSVEIDDVIENKIVAFSKYSSQVRPGGRDADSIRSQAKYRGQEVGKNLCEAFFVHRFIL